MPVTHQTSRATGFEYHQQLAAAQFHPGACVAWQAAIQSTPRPAGKQGRHQRRKPRTSKREPRDQQMRSANLLPTISGVKARNLPPIPTTLPPCPSKSIPAINNNNNTKPPSQRGPHYPTKRSHDTSRAHAHDEVVAALTAAPVM
ncbi:Uu.00g005690.m01.CDS01 [Anthostomella pinea]|uniref:Uu.00g005690.m01.CDS01 n=1 Tax=Anthostomella pinea TaxID=933095 RepID=A0AAI8VK79_9PEZI|nr:Uu.00g005690.m01.CDS01 [Anthostomella pinea]